MKKQLYLLYLLLLSVQLAIAQTTCYEYWLDNDHDGRTVVADNVTDVTLDLDISSMKPGLHYFNFRAQGDSAQWGGLSRYLFYIREEVDSSVVSMTQYEYWLDNQHEVRTAVKGSTSEVPLNLDISTLKPGLHYFNFRAQSKSGQWGGLSRYLFYIRENVDTTTSFMSQYEYWLDNQHEVRTAVKGSASEVPLDLDISSLKPGLHYFNFRVQGKSGQWGGLSRYLFYIREEADPTAASMKQYEYWLDKNYDERTIVKDAATDIPLNIDISGLKPGLHYFNVRAQGKSGQWGGLSRYLFYLREGSTQQLQLANIEYWIDERQDVMTQQVTDSTIVIMMDISKIENGTHTFYMEGITNNGSRCMVNAYEFNVGDVPEHNPEPYAVLTGDTITGQTVTFYYDNQKAARGGIDINNIFISGHSTPEYGAATAAIFDASFANYRPTSTAYWFMKCSDLTSVSGLEYLNTDSVTNMSYMFSTCYGLTSLDVSSFNTANVTNMGYMFGGCSGLTILDLSNFYTAQVTDMHSMFYYCRSLTTIYAGEGWSTAKVEEDDGMFLQCTSLVGGAGTVCDDNHTDCTYAHIDGGTANPGYFTPKNGYGPAAKPTFTHEGNLVFAHSTTEGATIRYTIDDLAPTDTTGIVYSDSIKVTRNCTIRAIATRENFTPSEVAEYEVNWFRCEKPIFAWNGDELTISTTTTDAAIRYTMSDIGNGLDTLSYSAPIEVKRDVVIRAWAEHMGMITSDTITLDYPYEAWRELSATTSECSAVANQCDGNNKVDQQAVQDLKMMCDVAYMMYMDRVASRDEIMQRKEELSALAAELLRQLNAIDYTFDGSTGVLAVNSGTTLAEALDAAGGRDEVAKTITAIVWNSTATLTNSDLQGLDNPNMLVYVQSASQAPANRDNVVIGNDSTGYMAKNIKLTDVTEGNGDFYCPIAFTAEMISYTHEYRQQTEVGVSRGWETIAMPFTVQTIMHEKNGLITPFGADTINKHFWLRQLTDQGLTQAKRVEANTPYLISMPNSDAYPVGFNLNGRVTFSSQNVEVPQTQTNVVETHDVNNNMVMLVPCFQSQASEAQVYALNVGEQYNSYAEGSVFVSNYRTIRPFEAFTVHHGNSPAPQFIPVSDINGGTTGIEDVRWKMEDGRSGIWYDLNGRKLQQKPTQKGVYLNNGRKVVVVH